MPPISVAFIATGLAVWLIGLQFLGIGARRVGDGPDPAVTVGTAALVAGLIDLVEAVYILAVRPAPLGDGAVVLSGLIVFYGAFFALLGWTMSRGGDLRPIGNLALAVALIPLLWWRFFDGGWMFHSILIVWAVVFSCVTATIYGRLPGRPLGALLVLTAGYTFFAPVAILALGHSIP